jgi:signal recognition particle GTPase
VDSISNMSGTKIPLRLHIYSQCLTAMNQLQIPRATKEAANPLSKLGQVLREKAKGDFGRIFKGTAKTRERLSIVEELMTYWKFDEAEDLLEELEDALISADFGPTTALKIVHEVRENVLASAHPWILMNLRHWETPWQCIVFTTTGLPHSLS